MAQPCPLEPLGACLTANHGEDLPC